MSITTKDIQGPRPLSRAELETLLEKARPILKHVARYGSTGFNDQRIAQEILKELER